MYPESERLIYHYAVLGQQRHADPLLLRRRLVQASGGQLDEILIAASEPDGTEADAPDGPPVEMFLQGQPATPEALAQASRRAVACGELAREEARERRARLIYAAFELPPFDPATGQGVLEAEALELLWDFLEWLEKNASPAGNSPEASPPTAGPPAGASPTRRG